MLERTPFHLSLFFKRSYHAAIHQGSPENLSRIVTDKSGNKVLTTLTGLDKELFPDPPTTLSAWIFRKKWRNLLRINRASSSTMTEYLEIPDQLYKCFDPKRIRLIFESPDKSISPVLLYAIPTPIWQDFIAQLSNQPVVQLLNLMTHRHLWMGYNYALMADSQILKEQRARLIGRFHFLLGLISKTGSHHLYKASSPQNQRFHELEEHMIQKLDEGYFDINEMVHLHSAMVPSFLRKMAHCVSIREVAQYAQLVSLYSTQNPYSSQELRTKKQTDAISWLPSSICNPHEFSRTVQIAKEFSKPHYAYLSSEKDKHINLGGLFFKSRKELPTYKPHFIKTIIDNTSCYDYLEALFHDLILPILVPVFWEKKLFNINFKEIKSIFFNTITETISLHQLDELQKRWHQHLYVLQALIPIDSYNRWTPIIENTELGGIKINVLTSDNELRSHGTEMKHCVRSYFNSCLMNMTNIIEMVDYRQVRSTLEIIYKPNSREIALGQHRGYKNGEPDYAHRVVAKKLIHMMNSGVIAVNFKRTSEKPRNANGYNIEVLFKNHLIDAETQEKIYQGYRAKDVLPTLLRAKDSQAMIQKLGVDDWIRHLSNESIESSFCASSFCV
jgi:hypothetical protein